MIRNWTIIVIASVFLIGGLSSPVLAKNKKRKKNVPVYYLSLGTSLAAGVQADPLTGQSIITDVSYPSELADILMKDIPKLRHKNFSCPGETATSFIDGGLCLYPQGSQLDQAIQFLHAHGKFTGLITIDLGANDILQCVDGQNIDLICFGQLLTQLPSELSYILETLREAAPGVPIVGMNYYNPLLVFWFENPAIAQLTVLLQTQINGKLEDVYADYDVPVADVAGLFMSYDLVTDNNGNFIPDSIDLLCAWTWMCDFLNIHANDAGYAAIAGEFVSVLPEIPISVPPRRSLKSNRKK